MTRTTPDPTVLARAVAPVYGTGSIEDLHRLSGGASRETWAFDLVTAADRHELILRRDESSTHTGESDRSTEYALLEAAARHDVPVPAVRVLLTPNDALGSGFIMDRIAGETIPRRILRDDQFAEARPLLAGQCGEVAARIHQVDATKLPELRHYDADAQIAQYRSLLDTFGEPHPAFEFGLRWLAEHRPPPAPQSVLVHGDFRNGNFIVGPEGFRAVLDWELAHLGDPAEDLGWLCVKSWRFGVVDKLVGGFGDVDALLAAYERAGGVPTEPETVRYWIAFGTLKWGVMCIGQSFTHIGGIIRSVELATLGRRIAEMEWDLLDIMDGGW